MNFLRDREVSVLHAAPPSSKGGGNSLSPGSFHVTGFLKLVVTDLPSSSSRQGCGDQTRALITSQMVSTYTPADAWHPRSSWGKDICDPSHKTRLLLSAPGSTESHFTPSLMCTGRRKENSGITQRLSLCHIHTCSLLQIFQKYLFVEALQFLSNNDWKTFSKR